MTYQNQDRAEFFVSEPLLLALEKRPLARGLHCYLKHISYLWRAITEKYMDNKQRLEYAWTTLCFVVYGFRHVAQSKYYTTNPLDSTYNFIPQQSRESTIQLATAFIFLQCVMVSLLIALLFDYD